MKPILLLIVVNLSVIQILNAQFDCSNVNQLDEQGKLFCIFDGPTAIIEHSTQTSENGTRTMVPIQSRTDCGLRNVGGLGMGSTTASVSVSVCMHSIWHLIKWNICVYR